VARGKKKKKKHGRGKAQARAPRMARGADKYRLYEESVQDVEGDIYLIERVFKKRFGRLPRTVREDFCGTAALSCAWVEEHRENRAFGIDLDPEPLEWCRQNHFPKLTADQRERCVLIQADVLDDETSGVDVTCAYNFSYFCFKTSDELLRYFRRARASLAPQGLFMIDLYGGADSQRTMDETREQEGFDYVWDQHLFDPITYHAINYIHFEFPDGSEMRRAFTYDWRLWTIPELRELMAQAGFSETEVYWEGTERKTNEGNGVYRKVTTAPDDPAWVSYIVAVR
jgi:SAM-dependent methyltransferase